MRTTLFLSISFILFWTTGKPQCAAYFSDTVSGDTAVFYNQSDTGTIHYYWSFPGGNPSWVSTSSPSFVPVVIYSSGTYTACLYTVDSINNCYDTACAIIVIGSGINVNLSHSNTVCGTCNGSASVSPSEGVSPYTYLWSNAATTQSITNLCAGSYSVTVTDNNSNTSTVSVNVFGVGGVSVNVTASNSSPCNGDTVVLTANVTTGSSPFTYQWQNGASTQQILVYSADSTISVTVTDNNGCTGDTFIVLNFTNGFNLNVSSTNETCSTCCDGTTTASASAGTGSGFNYVWSNSSTATSLSALCPGNYTVTVTDVGNGCYGVETVGVLAYTCYEVNGVLAQGMNAKVYLIEENSGYLSAADSVVTDSFGEYSFPWVCNGTYYIKGALLPSHAQYASYIPTYYDSSALWSGATAVVVNNANINNIYFSLLNGTNLGGPGFIGGLISQGANRAEGDPVANAQVILYNSNDELIAFTKTNANGEYVLDNLDLGSYKVYVDILNKSCYPFEVVITTENPEAYNRSFIVTGNEIKPVSPAAVAEEFMSQLLIYPNPANGSVFVKRGALLVRSVAIYNLMGEYVYKQPVTTGYEIITLDVKSLDSGTYIIELENEGLVYRQPIIIQ